MIHRFLESLTEFDKFSKFDPEFGEFKPQKD